MYCPDCGTKNTDDAIYCENCGFNMKKNSSSYAAPTSSQEHSDPVFQRPIEPEPSSQPHSSILDGLEDATVADFRDDVSTPYYILAFIFFPLGFFLWAFHRERKPESARKLFAATLGGMATLILLFIL